MKILVVCQYYKPEPVRITDLCEELVKRGHEVTVITGTPNYPEGVMYDGYKNGNKRNVIINGVKVNRCFTIPRGHNTILRFLNYYSYAISSTSNILLNKYRFKDNESFDVVFVNQLSPVMMAYAGIAYKKKYNKKLVLYCQDLWPQSLIVGKIDKNSILFKMFHNISKKIYLSCDHILVTSKMFINHLHKEFGIDVDKMSYLPQYAEDIFEKTSQKKIVDNDYVNFVFAGNIGEAQSIKTIIDAAYLLKDIVIKDKRPMFHIVGGGSDLKHLITYTKEKGLNNVKFYGRKPVDKMPYFYRKADAMLITLCKDPVLSLTLPGKVQSYMAFGKPIIGAIDGETKEIVKTAKCGFICSSENSKRLATNIVLFLKLSSEEQNKLGDNARKYYEEHLTKEKFMDTLNKTLKENC